jgi:hypothetical protein
MSSPDSRASVFLAGMLCLGIGFYILLPSTQKKRMTAYRSTSNYDFVLMIIAEIGLLSICTTLFLVSAELFEMALQIFIKDVEVNLIYLLLEPISYSITLVYVGEVIGFYGINQGKVKFSFLRALVSVVFFALSLMRFSNI